jgi:3-deoxy-D-manno-octulosonate 8-phosphate phosphatase (KDO 8-P phosphatase)
MDERMHRYGLKASEIMYMGDDLPDLAPMAMAGLSACPHDAATEVRQEADYISPKAGGKGCARDIIEQTLRLHGKWNQPELRNW